MDKTSELEKVLFQYSTELKSGVEDFLMLTQNIDPNKLPISTQQLQALLPFIRQAVEDSHFKLNDRYVALLLNK